MTSCSTPGLSKAHVRSKDSSKIGPPTSCWLLLRPRGLTERVTRSNERTPKALCFKPGQSGNPNGRPKGSRNKFTEEFLDDFREVWAEEGSNAIKTMAKDRPGDFVRVAAMLVPKELLLGRSNPLADLSDDELVAIIEALQIAAHSKEADAINP